MGYGTSYILHIQVSYRMRVLITGRPGIGKTTVVRKAISRLSGFCGGFYTEEIREGGKRVGFRIQALDGRTGILAHRRGKGTFFVKDKKTEYMINLKDLDDVASDALEKAVASSGIVVVDEIGHMELFSDRFKAAVLKVFESEKPVLATISKYGGDFEESLKLREDVKVLEIDEENRDKAVDEVIRLLRG